MDPTLFVTPLRYSFLANVKEHATLSAGARVDNGVEVETTGEHENRAADRGCCVSTCCASWIHSGGVDLTAQLKPGDRSSRVNRSSPVER
jgi:hypothetical protein